MRMFDILLFFALLGAVSGAISGVMSYSTDTWYPNYDAPDMRTIDTPYDERYNMNELTSSEDEYGAERSSSFMIIFETIKGIFLITVVASSVFYPGQAYLSTPLAGFFSVAQVGIWIIYIWGVAQIVTKTSVKNME
jgi:hypothetical protein